MTSLRRFSPLCNNNSSMLALSAEGQRARLNVAPRAIASVCYNAFLIRLQGNTTT
jgi:hypothetical protein